LPIGWAAWPKPEPPPISGEVADRVGGGAEAGALRRPVFDGLEVITERATSLVCRVEQGVDGELLDLHQVMRELRIG
jgi:hypothetical protein